MKKILLHKNNYIGFNDLPFMIVGVPVVAVMVNMIFFGINVVESWRCLQENAVPALFFTLLFWIGDRAIIIRLRKKYSHHGEHTKRLYLSAIYIVVYTALISIPLYLAEPYFTHTFNPDIVQPSYIKSFVASMFATALITSIYESGYIISRWKETIAETERLKKENIISQLEALKSQVNPHFLFNSLNTLASIIPDDPLRSVEFVQKLSLVYRCILEIKDGSAVTLEDELVCLNNYVFLLKTRFGENLNFEINISEESKNRFVVPLSIQILVENAIKHNIVSSRKPLLVRIITQGDEIIVENNLQIKAQEAEGTQTGLKNIRNRYKLAFEKEIAVEMDEEVFRVTLPLIAINDYDRHVQVSGQHNMYSQ